MSVKICPRCTRLNPYYAAVCAHCGLPFTEDYYPPYYYSAPIRGSTLRAISMIGFAVFVFGLLGWLYVASFKITIPNSSSWPLSSWTPWLTMGDFGIISFIISIAGLLFWTILFVSARERY